MRLMICQFLEHLGGDNTQLFAFYHLKYFLKTPPPPVISHIKITVHKADERIILKWFFKKWGGGGMDWIDMA
jgi:hypothetical protein